MPQDCIKGNRITLSKIGDVKIILHRPIPDGFKIKTAQIVKNADGWYVLVSLFFRHPKIRFLEPLLREYSKITFSQWRINNDTNVDWS